MMKEVEEQVIVERQNNFLLGKITPQQTRIAPTLIDPGERFRKIYDHIPELAESIKKNGVLQSLCIMEKEGEGHAQPYLLLAGGRRLTAALSIKLSEVPVHIYPTLGELEQREVELIENIQRDPLAYAEDVRLKAEVHRLEIAKYGQRFGGTTQGASHSTTAALLGESRANLQRDLELSAAMEIFPDLADKKNKSEAYRALQKKKEDMLHKQLAQRIQERSVNLDAVKQRLINSFIIGDFFDKIKEVPDGSIHGIELDPPYGVELSEISKAKGSDDIHDGYNEIPVDEYTEFLTRVLGECFRVLRSDGWLINWFASRWWTTVRTKLDEAGFRYHAVPALWTKPEPGNSRQPDVNLGIQWEPFFYARKPNAKIARPGRGNCFNYSRPNGRRHPAERPVELIQDILGTFLPPGASILVPFLGTGNTILAAANIGMKAFGYELTPKFKERYIVEVSEGEPGSYTSYS